MTRILLVATLASVAFATSAFAQTSGMMSDHMAKPMHMSKSSMKMMHGCEAMSHDMMMKNSKCMKMMKMHPDMMKGGMSDGMKSGMSDGKMEHQ